MFARHMDMRSTDRALQQRPEAFKAVGDGLTWRTAPALAAGMAAADHRFVGFDMPRKLVVAINFCHVLAQFMRHAPCRLVMHAKLAFEFLRRNSMARCSEQIHRVKPLLQWHASPAERRPYHRMNVVSAIAGIGGHPRELAELAGLTAPLAYDVLAIPLFEQMRQARIIIRKLCEKVLNSDALCHVSLQFGHYGISSSIRQADNRDFLTPEIAHTARRETAYREIGGLTDFEC
jgi:hypothetical protein